MNTLYYGDNLDILRNHIPDESVDLIYIDPPFNSNQAYNVIFDEQNGSSSEAQITAFEDTWHWGQTAEDTYNGIITTAPVRLAETVKSFRGFLTETNLMAYLTMMAVRLVELHRVLKSTGSFYLHCDPTASHYLKILMDVIFDGRNFRNEVVWKRTNVHSDSKTWSQVSDVIFFYTRSPVFTWNPIYLAHSEDHLKSKYRHVEADGRRYTLSDMTSPNPRPNMMYEWQGFPSPPKGWRYQKQTMQDLHEEGRIYYPRTSDGEMDTSKRPRLKRYLGEMPGRLVDNVWSDIHPINSQAAERLGYPTQKPEALLDRIISASSNEGDVVLDAFCGCGTTITVAQKLNRQWIGVDITYLAVSLMEYRLRDTFGDDVEYEVVGNPQDEQSAHDLAQRDRYQFQWWALSLVKARPYQGKKKGADQGVDGVIFFEDLDPNTSKKVTQKIVVQVKSGKVGVRDIRELKSVVESQEAVIGVFVTLQPPTGPMETEAVTAGVYERLNVKYPRIQIRTIRELLDGQGIHCPQTVVDATFKRAEKHEKQSDGQLDLL